MKLVTVIVPIYNVEKYLNQCLDSIINQTYRQLEIILVDDGSIDNSYNIANQYLAKDSRIKLYHQSNQGLSAARNFGLSKANGDYILFVDSDDFIELNLIECSVNDLEKQDVDMVIFSCRYADFENNKLIERNFVNSKIIDKKEALKLTLTEEVKSYAWSRLTKREAYKDIQYPVGKTFEDTATTYRIIFNCEKIYLSSRVLYNYRYRKNSITTTSSKDNRNNSFCFRYKRYLDIKEIYPDVASYGLNFIINSMVKYSLRSSYLDNRRTLKNAKLLTREENYSTSNKLEYLYINFNFLTFGLFKIKEHLKRIPVFSRLFQSIKKWLSKKSSHDNIILLKKDYKNILIGVPDHDNLGDHAIALAEIEYLKKELNIDKILVLSEHEFFNLNGEFKRKLLKSKNVFLQGGGNLGTNYIEIERIREEAIKFCTDCNILLFPQTLHMNKDEKHYKHIIEFYNKFNNVVCFYREKNSYDLAKKLFTNDNQYLVPDIVLSLLFTYKIRDYPRENKVTLLLRNDKERNIALIDEMKINSAIIKNITTNIQYSDTCIHRNLSYMQSEDELKNLWKQFSTSKMIITDRLHGLIFAVITKTPCIALPNYNHKVKGIYEWVKQCRYIKFIDHLDYLEAAINELKCLSNDEINDDYFKLTSYIKKAFKPLYERISIF